MTIERFSNKNRKYLDSKSLSALKNKKRSDLSSEDADQLNWENTKEARENMISDEIRRYQGMSDEQIKSSFAVRKANSTYMGESGEMVEEMNLPGIMNEVLSRNNQSNPIYQNKVSDKDLSDSDIFNPNFIAEIVASATVSSNYFIIKVRGKNYKVPCTPINQ